MYKPKLYYLIADQLDFDNKFLELIDKAASIAKNKYNWSRKILAKGKEIQSSIMSENIIRMWEGRISNLVILKPDRYQERKDGFTYRICRCVRGRSH